jgi:hypothetical protein
MAAYDITLKGCDESTTVTIETHEAGLLLLENVAVLTVQASQFDCMPTMTITPHTEVTE